MKPSRIALTAILLLAVASFAYFGYQRRFQLAVKLWHWRHGHSVTVGQYEVPVPNNWAVTHQTDHSADLIGTTQPTYGSRLPPVSLLAVQLISRPPMSAADLEDGRLKMRQYLEGKGVKDIEEHSASVDGESISCVGGLEFSTPAESAGKAKIGLDCSSTGALYLRFQGWPADLQDFYSILARIHKLR